MKRPVMAGIALFLGGCAMDTPPPATTSTAGAQCLTPSRGRVFEPELKPDGAVRATGIAMVGRDRLVVLGASGPARAFDLTTGQVAMIPRHDAPVLPGRGGSADLPGGRAEITSNGRVRVTTLFGQNLDLILSRDGWAAVEASGRFDGSADAIATFRMADSRTSLRLSALAELYHEPGLLLRRLKGEALRTVSAPDLDKGLPAPPKVLVKASMGGGDVLTGAPVTVTVAVEDNGGCIRAVRLLHNERMVADSAIRLDRVERDEDRAVRRIVYDLTLVPGLNRFEAAALSGLGIEGERSNDVIFTRDAMPSRR